MEKYYGNYLGIVVSRDGGDPERRGRVQIWIPGVTNTFYSGWNDDIKNKNIYYLGDDSNLSSIDVERLRKVLPWAECASPLIGGGTPLYYNENRNGAYQESVPETLSENFSKADFDTPLEEMNFNQNNQETQNTSDQNSMITTGEFYETSPGVFEADITGYVNPVSPSNMSPSGLISDENTTDTGIETNVNSVQVGDDSGGALSDTHFANNPPVPYGEGTPDGTFSIPKCGSRVWIFFHGGDIQKPVYFAYSLAPTDHQNFYGYGNPPTGSDVSYNNDSAITTDEQSATTDEQSATTDGQTTPDFGLEGQLPVEEPLTNNQTTSYTPDGIFKW